MKTTRGWLGAFIPLVTMLVSVGCDADSLAPEASTEATASPSAAEVGSSRSFPVSGSGVHYFSSAIVHSQETTATGMIQRSTDIIELSGDLSGYILYHPTSVFDFGAGTLLNTGTQIFSGTVAGSGPVLLHDDEFSFEVDLATGETQGDVHLGRSHDAPHPGHWYECDLVVVGTGVTPEGDNLSDYSGTCTRYGNPR